MGYGSHAAYSCDGGKLVTVSPQSPWRPQTEVACFDTSASSPFASFTTPEPVRIVAINRSGNRLACQGRTLKSIDILDSVTGRRLRRLPGDSVLQSIAFSPNGYWVFAAGVGKQVLQWEVETGRLVRTYQGPGGIDTLAVSVGGLLACGSHLKGLVQVWEVRTGAPVCYTQAAPGLTDIAFSRDGNRLAAVSVGPGAADPNASSAIRVWNLATLRLEQEIRQPNPVRSVAFAADGMSLIAAVADGSIGHWKLEGTVAASGGPHAIQDVITTKNPAVGPTPRPLYPQPSAWLP
jgi:WD40 repeat protein